MTTQSNSRFVRTRRFLMAARDAIVEARRRQVAARSGTQWPL
ncbi:MAG: hypothetical protein ACXIVF_12235 [Rhizobiaceae bacterium]